MRKKRMKMTRSLNSRRRRVMPSSRLGFWHPSSYSPFPCFMKCLKQITNEVNNECLRFVEDRRGRRYEWNSIVCLPSKSINGTKFEYFPSAFGHWLVVCSDYTNLGCLGSGYLRKRNLLLLFFSRSMANYCLELLLARKDSTN